MTTISAPLVLWDQGVPTNCFRADVLRGLSAAAKAIPCKYFYDEAGSKLFDLICALEEYYPTRTELTIMEQHITKRWPTWLVLPVCWSSMAVAAASSHASSWTDWSRRPRTCRSIFRVSICARPRQPWPAPTRTWRCCRSAPTSPSPSICQSLPYASDAGWSISPDRRLAMFTPGREAIRLCRRTAQLGGPSSGLLFREVDLKKDPKLLHAAYNDRQGVTAAFNLNLLERINRELGADFQTAQFWHHASYNPREGRIEMYLVSHKEQRARIGSQAFTLAEGEAIRTEYSYKYNSTDLRHLARAGGYEVRRVWTDERNHFCVAYLMVAEHN